MNTKTSEPRSNEDIGKQVITSKRQYFVPDFGVSVEADDCEEAVEKAKKLTEKEEVGDGNK